MLCALWLCALASLSPTDWIPRHLVCHRAVQEHLPALPFKFENLMAGPMNPDTSLGPEAVENLMVFPGRVEGRLGLWLLVSAQSYFIELPRTLVPTLGFDASELPYAQIELLAHIPERHSAIVITVTTTLKKPFPMRIEVTRPVPGTPGLTAVQAVPRSSADLEEQSDRILFEGSKASVLLGGLSDANLHAFDACKKLMEHDPKAKQFYLDLDLLTHLPPLGSSR